MDQQLTIIRPRRGWHPSDLKELWRYRELLTALSLRDIKVRYKQTILGVAWAVIQPLTTMLIFSFIFGRLAGIPSDGFPYPVFVFSGLLAWTFFSSAVSTSSMSLLSAGGMISKVYFPRLLLPLSAIGVSVVDFTITVVLLFLLMVFYSIVPTWQLLLFPVFFAGLIVLALGLGVWLAAVNVAYRDFRFVVPFMLQITMYLTPVIYPVSFIPEQVRWVIYFNPLLGWISGIRASFLGSPIDWYAVGTSLTLTMIILVIGLRYFQKAERRFADII